MILAKRVMAAPSKPRTIKAPQVKDQPLFIGGKWLDSVSGKTFPAINPATGGTICQVAEGHKGRCGMSGQGRENGEAALEDYTETKTVTIKLG